MDSSIREFVRQRAGDHCEYCHLPQQYIELNHHIEHIIAKQHGGIDADDNLALACHRCNLHKGPNLTGIDPLTGETTSLFHPRRHRWADHFVFRGARIEGTSPTGRTTVRLLAMNDSRRIELRTELLAADDVFLPSDP